MAKLYRHSDSKQRAGEKTVYVSVPRQQLTLKQSGKALRTYSISTSMFGVGTEEGSMKTPPGRFRIAEKIGDDTPIGTIFKERRPISQSAVDLPDEDLVMSRILWLDGIEDHNANTFDRYIYIHGTNHEEDVGKPASHGCIRMRNADMIELFDLVERDTSVVIEQ